MIARRVLGALVGLVVFAAPAAAHDAPFSYLNLRIVDGRLEGVLVAHIVDLAHESGDVPDSLLVPARVDAVAPALWATLAKRMTLTADGTVLRPAMNAAEPDTERTGVSFVFDAPLPAHATPEAIVVAAKLFPYDPQHETFVNLYADDTIRAQDMLDARTPRVVLTTGPAPKAWTVFRRFVGAGIHHIFIGPDHILFIVGLLLLGGSIRQLLKIITGFTIAHSITLALATFGIVQPPARIIEPLIALSIVFVGVQNLRAPTDGGRDRRAWFAFLFGFVHGFGFASVLREFGLPAQSLGLALFSFNVGVEIGQAAIVLAVAPALALLRTTNASAARRAAFAGSLVVVAAGSFWFVERVFAR